MKVADNESSSSRMHIEKGNLSFTATQVVLSICPFFVVNMFFSPYVHGMVELNLFIDVLLLVSGPSLPSPRRMLPGPVLPGLVFAGNGLQRRDVVVVLGDGGCSGFLGHAFSVF